ncbi:hypothetical protein LD39_08025 [Halobacillus sp. BBL2006]|nr:hypothetical protein LD39_08025 [Halobacillus sp. BBL2006]
MRVRTKTIPNLLLLLSFMILLLFLIISFFTKNYNYSVASLVTIGLINTSMLFGMFPIRSAQKNRKKAIRIRKF